LCATDLKRLAEELDQARERQRQAFRELQKAAALRNTPNGIKAYDEAHTRWRGTIQDTHAARKAWEKATRTV
jgi:excinuclease UvrABC nuclease subunit